VAIPWRTAGTIMNPHPEDDSIRRLASALGHPRRLHILLALGDGPGSATSLVLRVDDGATRKDLEYHLKLLAQAGAIKLARQRQVRGARESIYELVATERREEARDVIPSPILRGLQHAWSYSSQNDPDLTLP
jgi:DNA-binding transcriptional ArsR family regulator